MTYLTVVLAVKIFVTLILVVFPFLFMPLDRLEKLVLVKADSPLLMRLYGVAILALLVGYSSAFPSILSGSFPWGVVIMGLVSNAGAAGFLFFLGSGKQSRITAAFFGIIAISLVVAISFPEFSIKGIW